MEPTTYVIRNDKQKKRIQHDLSEVIMQVDEHVVENSILSKKGTENMLMTMFSFLSHEKGPYFPLFVTKSKSLILAKKERQIEGKSVIRVLDVVDGELFTLPNMKKAGELLRKRNKETTFLYIEDTQTLVFSKNGLVRTIPSIELYMNYGLFTYSFLKERRKCIS